MQGWLTMKKSVNHPLLSNSVIVRKLVAPKLGYLPVRDRESLLKCPLWLTNFGWDPGICTFTQHPGSWRPMPTGLGSHLEVKQPHFLPLLGPTGRHSAKQRECWGLGCVQVLTQGGWRWGIWVHFPLLGNVSVSGLQKKKKFWEAGGEETGTGVGRREGGVGGKKKAAPKETEVLVEVLGIFGFQSSRGTMCSPEARIFLRRPGV